MKIKNVVLGALGVAVVCGLGACSSTGYGYHDAVKIQTAGINFSGSTGVSAGYLSATVDRVANVDKNGKPITVGGPCDRTSGGGNIFDTYANLNSKANASATSVSPGAAAGAVAGGVNSPQIAWASGDVTANGDAAFVASAAAVGNPADVIAALCGNQTLPAAPGGSIVRQGVAPGNVPVAAAKSQ